MVGFLGQPNMLGGTPERFALEYIDDAVITRPDVAEQKDPHISFARMIFPTGAALDAAIPAWKSVFEETKGESGSFVYGLALDKDKRDTLYTMQMYESEGYLRNVHLKENKAVEGTKATLTSNTSVEHNVLKFMGGYFTK